MSGAGRRWILFCFALLLTAGASYFEFQAFATGYTAGDYAGPDTQQSRQWIREFKQKADIYTAEAMACLIVASICLGTAWRRGDSKRPISTYIKAFSVCLLASLLPIYVIFRLISLNMQ